MLSAVTGKGPTALSPMPVRYRLDAIRSIPLRRRADTDTYAATADSVPSRHGFTASRTIALTRALGLSRLAVGAAFLAAPVPSVRLLGVDSGTARRMTFLARMAAARDLALGAGSVAAGRGAASWVLAAALADAVDAAAIATAIRQRQAGGVPAYGFVAGAAGAAMVGVATARALHRG